MHAPRITASSLLVFATMALAMTVPAEAQYRISSFGRTNAITFDGVVVGMEWAGATTLNIDPGHPMNPMVLALHKSDGIYLFVQVVDAVFNPNDEIRILFDIDHSGGTAVAATDWGLRVHRGGPASDAARWGPANVDPSTWTLVPAGFQRNTTSTGWSMEVRLDTGAPSNLSFSTDSIGIYFLVLDLDALSGPTPSAGYVQWPPAPSTNPNDILDDTPDSWGHYVFDPATTFANIAVTGVRNRYDGAENYWKISHTADNIFEVQLNNPAGPVSNPANVRVNLYLAARGIGEPWHRIDQGGVIDGDCGAATWASPNVPKNQVCSGTTSLPDISTLPIDPIVAGTAAYTTKDGVPMTRLGGPSFQVPVGSGWIDILQWNTTAAQDDRYKEVVVNGTTYKRQHQCMKAEAIAPNDPNRANNTYQVNMDFVCVPGAMMTAYFFSLGWAGFGDYDPQQGEEMFLQVERRNMDPREGWKYELVGAQPTGGDAFKAGIRGQTSLGLQVQIQAPSPAVLGHTLKENLVIPPTAGGRAPTAPLPSGSAPIYVKVTPGSRLLIATYAFDDNDVQFVDLDSARKWLPPNGPEGLALPYLDRLLKELSRNIGLLLAPSAPLGSLVGSFDDFRTSFKVGDGVGVTVPPNARYLALGINDVFGFYNDNGGPGFRVKIMERAIAGAPGGGGWGGGSSDLSEVAHVALGAFPGFSVAQIAPNQSAAFQVDPIGDLAPTLCINGYEATGQTRTINGAPHPLFRYIGNVCWSVRNVYPPNRSREPDRGDPVEPGPGNGCKGGCGCTRLPGTAKFLLLSLLGIVVVARKRWRL